MKRAIALLAALLLCFLCSGMLQAQNNAPVLKARVTDTTGTLSAQEVQEFEQKLAALEKKKGAQFAVLMINSTDDIPIEEYALRVAEKNKIGREKPDDGLLLLVAKQDRKMRIEVGYGLEGAVPDVIAARVIREYLAPSFRQGDYAGGIRNAIDVLGKIIEGEPLPEPAAHSADGQGMPPIMLSIVIGIVCGFFALSTQIRPVFIRRVLAGGAAGFILLAVLSTGLIGLIGAVIAFLISGASSSGRYITHGGGGWGGGSSSGGSWGGGSSSGGGWSGGGGSFGGGGASGGW